MAHPGGRPLLFKSADDLQKKIDTYFASEDFVTMSGLSLALGIDRKTLLNYTKRDEYFPVIKKAREKIAANVEKLLLYDGQNAAGRIFWLKNNGGYVDRQDHNVGGQSENPIISVVKFDKLQNEGS